MKHALPLPDSKKLTVTFRVEPGCLGPTGGELIADFCAFAQKSVETLDSDYVIWNIVPRFDKSLKELQYSVIGKNMNHDQAEKYLGVFDQCLDEFEGHLEDKLATLIDEFSSR